jgi:hypothetical protein
MEAKNENIKKHKGSCHCGANRFEVEIDATKGTQCNCTICQKTHSTNAMTKPAAFTLLTDEKNFIFYGDKQAGRYFCKTCGVHCYGKGDIPEIGGEFVSVNLNTLDDIDQGELTITYWDGRHNNWHAGMRSTPWPIFPK